MKRLLFFFIFLLSIGLVNGATVTVQTGTADEGYEIQYPPCNTFEQGQDVNLRFHVYNKTNGVNVAEGVSCNFHLYRNNGSLLFQEVKEGNSHDFEYIILGGNFSDVGDYCFIIHCNNSLLGGFVNKGIRVNKSGTNEDLIYFLLLIAGIPLIIGLLILLGSFFLDGEEHPVFKISMMLFSFVITMASPWFAQIIIGTQFPKLTEVAEGLSFFTWFYGITLSVFIMYFLIYGMTKMFHKAAQNDAEDEIKY